MAGSVDIQKLADGPKGTIIKVVYESDGSTDSGVVLVDTANLSGALNTAGNIKVGVSNTKPYYRTTVHKMFGHGQFKSGGHANVRDNANVVTTIGAGPIDLDFDIHGLGNIAANGDLKLYTTSMNAGDAFTLIIQLKKDPRDYTVGQHADPVAFNIPGF
jgi:hypothetical protein